MFADGRALLSTSACLPTEPFPDSWRVGVGAVSADALTPGRMARWLSCLRARGSIGRATLGGRERAGSMKSSPSEVTRDSSVVGEGEARCCSAPIRAVASGMVCGDTFRTRGSTVVASSTRGGAAILGVEAGARVESSSDDTFVAMLPVAIAATAAVPIVAIASFQRGYRRSPGRVATPVRGRKAS